MFAKYFNQLAVHRHCPRVLFSAPGKVSNLMVVGRGWSHLVVKWQLPLEFTGDIVGYNLDYSVGKIAFMQMSVLKQSVLR